MKGKSRTKWAGVTVAALAVAAGGIAGCGGSSGSGGSPVAGAQTTAPVGSGQTPSPDPLGTKPPTTSAPLPDGVYRTRLTTSALTHFGIDDLSQAGTWTLTVHKGRYTLECGPIHDPAIDCGESGFAHPTTVEIGFLRGDRHVVWHVHDLKATAKLPGCPNLTCPTDGYRMTWSVGSHGELQFAHFLGFGDEASGPGARNNWTLQPWTKIS